MPYRNNPSTIAILVAREYAGRSGLHQVGLRRKGAQLNVEHLREFVSLARTSSFTKSARELNVSQPTLSKHIAALERELGFSLFDRSTTSVVLTQEGRTVFEGAHRALQTLDGAVLQARIGAAARVPVVRVGGYLSLTSIVNFVYEAEGLCPAHGGAVKVSFVNPIAAGSKPDEDGAGVLALLDNDVADMVLFEGPEVYPELDRFEHACVFHEPLVFFADAAGAVAHREAVGIADLHGMQFVGSLNHVEFQDRVREVCAACGFVPDFRVRCFNTVHEHVRSCGADEVTFLSESGAAKISPGALPTMKRLNMVDPLAYSPVWAVWRRTPAPGVARLAAAMRDLGVTR